MPKRASPAALSMRRTRPRSVISPVNMTSTLVPSPTMFPTDRRRAVVTPRRSNCARSASRSTPKASTAGMPSPPIMPAAAKPGEPVDQSGAQQHRRQRRPALDQQAGDARAGRTPGACPSGPGSRWPAPAARSARRRDRAARRRAGYRRRCGVTIQVGISRAVRTSFEVSGRRSRQSTTMRTGWRGASPGRRQVSSGSSVVAVPTPTRIAS